MVIVMGVVMGEPNCLRLIYIYIYMDVATTRPTLPRGAELVKERYKILLFSVVLARIQNRMVWRLLVKETNNM